MQETLGEESSGTSNALLRSFAARLRALAPEVDHAEIGYRVSTILHNKHVEPRIALLNLLEGVASPSGSMSRTASPKAGKGQTLKPNEVRFILRADWKAPPVFLEGIPDHLQPQAVSFLKAIAEGQSSALFPFLDFLEHDCDEAQLGSVLKKFKHCFSVLAADTHFASLSNLNFSNHQIGDDGIEAITHMTSLIPITHLSLQNCGITHDGLQLLADCENLESLTFLNISRNVMGDLFPIHCEGTSLTNIVELDISHCQIFEISAYQIMNSLHLRNLRKLHIGGNGIDAIYRLHSLTVVPEMHPDLMLYGVDMEHFGWVQQADGGWRRPA